LWREAKERDRLRSAREFEARRAGEEKWKARIAEAKKRKQDEEEKAKEAALAARQKALEPKPFVSHPIYT
jgi:hypothetical protein